MPHGWIILDTPLVGAMKRGAILTALVLTSCGLLPRTSADNEVLDTVLVRVDPFGDCVTVDGRTTIFKDIGGPDGPPGQITAQSFEDADARSAAAAIAVSFQDSVRGNESPLHFGARDAQNCPMNLSMPAYSGDFAFVDYSEPGGGIGVYVFRKDGSRWSVIEHKVLGFW